MGAIINPPKPDPPKPPPEPTEVDDNTTRSRREARRRIASSRGRGSTILTRPQGLVDANVSGKTLLGT